jgi:hypothetical protein
MYIHEDHHIIIAEKVGWGDEVLESQAEHLEMLLSVEVHYSPD